MDLNTNTLIIDFTYETLLQFRETDNEDEIKDFQLTTLNSETFWFIHPCQFNYLLNSPNNWKIWLMLFLSKLNITKTCLNSPN